MNLVSPGLRLYGFDVGPKQWARSQLKLFLKPLPVDPMQKTPASPPSAELANVEPADAVERMSLLAATELQDHLLIASNDLDRLQRLLNEAGDSLITHFHAAASQMKAVRQGVAASPEARTKAVDVAMNHLASAITCLQFQDMASQLLTHTGRRLRGCADRLAAEIMGPADDGEAFLDTLPLNLNPVTQDEMDAGSVELF